MNTQQTEKALKKLETRFHENPERHKKITWADVKAALLSNEHKLQSLASMEETGGEPDVVGYDLTKKEIIIFDCSLESPSGRRNLCYDRKALEKRKKNKPQNSALDMANSMGIELLTEDQYRALQTLGEFDTKTSSWIITPDKIRSLGGALFCDRRYDHVFVYRNSAESYYASRGFRGCLRV